MRNNRPTGVADLNEMLVFTRVVQSGSFTAAARLLGMPKSTVSRKLSDLETRIGARLLQRTTRKLGLTDAGRIYYAHSARIAAAVEEAEQAVGEVQASPRGMLRVTTPLSFGMLGPVVSDYLRLYPDVQITLTSTDRVVNLIEEGFDVAIRAGRLADSTVVARSLGALKRVLVASPRYCKDRGVPRNPNDLRKHACLSFGAGAAPNLWLLQSGSNAAEIRVSPRMTTNDSEILHQTALAGVGIAWLPEYVCSEDLRAGRLRHVLAEWSSPETPVHAVYPTARHLSPKVVSFIEFIRAKLHVQ